MTWDSASDGETYTILATGLTDISYTATGLTASSTYCFKVQSRNIHGTSAYSSTVCILSAQTPNKPDQPTTTFVGTDIVIRWTAPISGGSPIIAY